MWYDFKHGKSAAESHRALFKEWFKRFRSGDESLADHEHGHRAEVVDNDLLKEAIESDPCQTTRELAEQFGCTHGTIENHLYAIGKTNRCGKWVPHQLSNANKATRVTMDLIVTSDEKWIRYDNAIRKRQWLDPGEAPKPDIHGKKVMLCVWWNSKGLVYFEVLDSGQTVTADLYQHQLDRVDQALRRQGVDTASTKFLHVNARPHVAKITARKIEELGWEVLTRHTAHIINFGFGSNRGFFLANLTRYFGVF